MTRSYVRHDSFICVTWLNHIYDMNHSYMWHDTFTRVTWLIDRYVSLNGAMHAQSTWRADLLASSQHFGVCDMTHSYVWHDSFICATWLIHTCDVWRADLLAFSQHFGVCDTTHSYVWHDTLIRATWRIHTCDVWRADLLAFSQHFNVCDMTHWYVWYFFYGHVRRDLFIRVICVWYVGLTRLRADFRATPTSRGGSAECPKRTRGEWDAGVENKNTQNTQMNLNKWKLGEP